MSQEINFNLSAIILIKLYKESVCTHWLWRESKPIKTIFGLIDTGRVTEAGFEDMSSLSTDVYTDEELKEYGYKVYTMSERVNSRVANKPYVEIILSHKQTVYRKFENDDDAVKYIEHLKAISDIKFETIVYGNS
jgi:hypothetical protein